MQFKFTLWNWNRNRTVEGKYCTSGSHYAGNRNKSMETKETKLWKVSISVHIMLGTETKVWTVRISVHIMLGTETKVWTVRISVHIMLGTETKLW